MDDSMISEYVEHNDAILLVVIPATQAPELSSSRALKIVKEFDAESTRTVGIISKIDQAASEPKALAAVQAPLLNQGPPKTSDIPWVALIGQSVSIASAQSGAGSENSLETAWRAESESLKSILTGAPQSKLGRVALVEALAGRIHSRMKLRLPNLLSGLQGKSQFVQDELVRLGEQMVNSAEGTRAIALQLCREFEDKFLLHITGGEGSGWKVVARFEGNFPNRIKQLPLDRHFDINNVKRIVLEADGYQPYLISAEKGLRSLIKGVLEPAKEPSRLCVDEGHLFLVRSLLEALGPLLLKQVPLEAQINNHSQHLEVVCLVPPHLLVRQVNLHLVQVVLQLLGQPALLHLVLQAPQPSVLQALQPLVQQQLLHLAAQGLHLACQMLLYLDLAEHLELQAALYLVPQAHLHLVPRALLHLVPQALLHLVLQLLQLLVPQRLHLVLQALLLLGLLLPRPLALGPLQLLANQVVDKPAPVQISSLLTSRHLSQRRIRLPARKYHTKNDGPKVPFFSDDEETHQRQMLFSFLGKIQDHWSIVP